jgi:hypothetical protein
MINIKPAILQALEANTALVSLLGGKRIYQMYDPNSTEFPRITFFEYNNVDSNYADDSAFASDINIQIDVWSKASTSAIALEVNRTMESLDFVRTYSIDLYESDTKIFHKTMRFKTTKLIEE